MYPYTIDTTVSVSVSDTVTDTVSAKKKTSKFCKPTLEEVEQYIQEKGLDVDAKYFYDYFEEGNWIDGQGKPVKNWKQKIITWNMNNKKKNTIASRQKDILEEMMKELEGNEQTADTKTNK